MDYNFTIKFKYNEETVSIFPIRAMKANFYRLKILKNAYDRIRSKF